MERLERIEQLKKGIKFHVMNRDIITSYEFLCIHPHNESYILAIESMSQDAKKMHIKSLMEYAEVYIGDYEVSFFREKEIEYYERMIIDLKQRPNLNK